jgi:hypothetical protein
MLKDASVSEEPSSFVVGATQDRSAVPSAATTATVTGRLVVPPAPVQLKVKVLSWVSGPTLWLPVSALEPDQAPEALHEVALLEDHVSIEDPFMATLVGLAVRVTVGSGAGSTVTVTDWPALPPAPVHVRMNVLLAVNDPRVSLPEVALVPDHAPEAVHEVALLEDQVSVEEPL